MGTFVLKIVSGGQTGVDRAALDWAIEHGIVHGGWCPAGRRAEDGPIDARYRMQETPSRSYRQRTSWNVRDSDGTIIISLSPALTGGSLQTREAAKRLGKPWVHVYSGIDAVSLIRCFVREHRISVLNVAGPRASSEPTVAAFVRDLLTAASSKGATIPGAANAREAT